MSSPREKRPVRTVKSGPADSETLIREDHGAPGRDLKRILRANGIWKAKKEDTKYPLFSSSVMAVSFASEEEYAFLLITVIK